MSYWTRLNHLWSQAYDTLAHYAARAYPALLHFASRACEILLQLYRRLRTAAATRTRLFVTLAIMVVLAGGLLYAVVLGWSRIPGISTASDEKITHSLLWRLELYFWKLVGRVPDLSWGELRKMTWPGSGFFLAGHVKEGRSLEAVIANPYTKPGDIKTGKDLFSSRCGACHGADGKGRTAPALAVPHLSRGDSDFILYKHIRDGIPGTAMPSAQGLSFEERWQVVGFLRTLMGSRFSDRKPARDLNVNVAFDDILKARGNPNVWLTYAGALDGWRYSPLTEITPQNAGKLRLLWSRPFSTEEKIAEAVPLVVDGTIFIVEPPNNVLAMEASTGKVLWRYQRSLPQQLPLCCGRVNRGLAVLGDTLFLGTLDARLVAINAKTGEVKWEIEVANSSEGYSITGAPLAVKDAIVVGISGGEFGVRGFLAAYDAKTGAQKWRFNTIPGPGEPGHETWKNDAWKKGGGPTWITGSYDPHLNLLFWGVGNPSPTYLGEVRPGDNLFTASALALDADTGRLRWYFQFTPHDENDWGANQTPILAELKIGGVMRKVVCWANRNGFYYVLDRETGEFLHGSAFVEQNWTTGLSAKGRPMVPEKKISPSGRLTRPGVDGGVNWQQAAFDPASGTFFVHASENSSVFTKSPPERFRPGRGGFVVGSGSYYASAPVTVVRALDAATGAKRWEYFSPRMTEVDQGRSGLVATAGGVLFGASGGTVFALDMQTGKELWRVPLGGYSMTAPITFRLGDKQVVGLSVGRAFFLFGL
jgi:alcohol dehydrogenase (cytochrome c)